MAKSRSSSEYMKTYNKQIKSQVLEKVREYKNSRVCVDCGKSYHFSAMDFDHVEDNKKFNISRMGSTRWEKVLIEIQKCELVCSNCHRIRTYNRKHMAC